jgi:hypothetical protein
LILDINGHSMNVFTVTPSLFIGEDNVDRGVAFFEDTPERARKARV